MTKILIAGGGTGGHLFPGLALAEELKARGHDLLFVGTARGIEARVLPRAGWPLELIEVEGLKGRGASGLFQGLGRVPRAILQSRAILRRFGAELVVGVGGYASGPVVLAAALAGLPTAILEQNSIPGITNRILGKLVRRVYISFAESARFFPASKLRPLGNPLRAPLRAAVHAQSAPGDGSEAGARATQPAPGEDPAPQLLVLGGSQGARALNELVPAALALLHKDGRRLPRVLHQTGDKERDEVARRYAEAGVAADVRAFIDDMAAVLAAAELVVGRAGATSIAELTAFGRAAVLIPFPFAADDHQRLNARALADAGAAVVLDQTGLEPRGLADALAPLLDDPGARARMAAASRALGRPDAAQAIADDLLEMTAAG